MYLKNGVKAEMLLTDTDSLTYIIETENVNEDFYKDKDFSNFPKESKYYDDLNNLIVDKMKDETCIVPIIGSVTLKSEMHK